MVWNGQTPIKFAGDKPIALLAYLLLHRHTPVSRQHLAFILWPDSTDSQARTNLRNLFYTVRQTIDDPDLFLAADGMTLQWRGDAPFNLDVADFTKTLKLAHQADSAAEKISHLEKAVQLYRGDLLPGNYDDWIMPLREDLLQSYLDAVHQLVDLLEEMEQFRPAARYAQRLLQLDPLDETTYVQLMRLHAHLGDRAGVRRIFDTCTATLKRELDVEPSPATQTAFDRFLRAEMFAPRASFLPPVVLPDTPAPKPLPAPATPFFGREEELANLETLFSNGKCRLISIVGPGGIGKTRLALRAAALHNKLFPDGVAYVPLVAVTEGIHIVSAIAQSLNFTFSGQNDLQTQLVNFIRGKRMLLVLDNFEQLLPEADTLSQLVQETSSVVFLVTSRERLNLTAEWLLPIDGLPLPEGLLELADSAAVKLFIHNAVRLGTELTPTDDNLNAVRRICQLVDGLPLGIELAATWMRVLSIGQIAAELEQGIDLLNASTRQVPSRHETISTVFDYSWDLLTPAEQQLLVRLSIFRGGFTHQAAEFIAGEAVLQNLSALVDKSFVRPAQQGRHSIHELIRQYAGQKLASDSARKEETAARHGRYFLNLWARQEAIICSPRQKEALQLFAIEYNNLMAAWRWATRLGQSQLLRAASWPFWYAFELTGTYQAGENALRMAEETLAGAADPGKNLSADQEILIARLQAQRAFFTFRCGRNHEAMTALTKAVETLRRFEDEDALADALWTFGAVAWVVGQFENSEAAFREAQPLSEKFSRKWPVAVNRIFLGMVLHDLGEYESAYAHLSDGLARARVMGDPRPITFGTSFLSRTAQILGRTEELISLLQAGLEQAVEMNDRFAIGLSCEQLGQVALSMDQPDEALRLFGEAVAIYRETGDRWSLARVLIQRGDGHLKGGAADLAKIDFREALTTAAASETWPFVHQALFGLARLDFNASDFESAYRHLMVIMNHGPAPALKSQVEPLWGQAAKKIAPAKREAVHAWMGARPLEILVEDLL